MKTCTGDFRMGTGCCACINCAELALADLMDEAASNGNSEAFLDMCEQALEPALSAYRVHQTTGGEWRDIINAGLTLSNGSLHQHRHRHDRQLADFLCHLSGLQRSSGGGQCCRRWLHGVEHCARLLRAQGLQRAAGNPTRGSNGGRGRD